MRFYIDLYQKTHKHVYDIKQSNKMNNSSYKSIYQNYNPAKNTLLTMCTNEFVNNIATVITITVF